MTEVRRCSKCGAPLRADTTEASCPACAMRGAFVSAEDDDPERGCPQPQSSQGASTASPSPGGEGRSEGEREIKNPQSQIHKPPVSLSHQMGERSEVRVVRYFGDYELLEEIARGGMGVVYRARQVTLNRTVAVKMILAGQLASTADVNRFRAEAEAAAHLQHPNIVAIHEVGEHDGQHYFSMDYVEGKNLAELVRDGPPPARQAAIYLKTIAETIHFAHQQGILHRDLKPSNVLIDLNDHPRITDFGLAKRLGLPQSSGALNSAERAENPSSASRQPDESGRGLPHSKTSRRTDPQLSTLDPQLTLSGQVLGSPNFMPPEQAAGKRGRVGVHSDIYSLGAILYYLLTGRPPFVAETLTDTLQQVCNVDPVSPRLLNASVPRDVETICLKCLEKDPGKRYTTAQELADELGRFLNNEPVHARPVGPAGKAWRWCRRKRALAASLAAILSLLLVVSIGSPIAAFRINRERHLAEQNAARSEQVAKFLKDMLKGVQPSVALGRDTTMLREILDKTATRLDKDLKGQPGVEAELRETIARVYFDIGQYEKSEAMHREALAIWVKLFGKENPYVADLLGGLARALYSQNKCEQAESVYRQALAMRRKVFGDEDPAVAMCLKDLAWLLYWTDRNAEAEAKGREALAINRKLYGEEHLETAASLSCLALPLMEDGKTAEAESMQRETVATLRKLLGDQHPSVASSLCNLSLALVAQGKLAEAVSARREAVGIATNVLGNNHPQVAFMLVNLADLLQQQGTLTEAETLFREALAIRRKLFGDAHTDVAKVLTYLGNVLRLEGKQAEAEKAYREALAIPRELILSNSDRPDVTCTLIGLGRVLRSQGRLEEAETYYREALAVKRRMLDMDSANLEVGFRLQILGDMFSQDGNLAEAEDCYREATATRRKLSGNENLGVADSLHNCADVLSREGKLAEAEVFYREAAVIRRKLSGNENSGLAGSLHNLADVLRKERKLAEAESLYGEALAIRRKVLGDADPSAVASLTRLADVLTNQSKYAEAETLLLEGNERLQQSKSPDRKYKRAALKRLVQLYEVWDRAAPNAGKSAQAEAWRKKLEALRTEAEVVPGKQKPE